MNDDLISRSALKETIRKRLGISSLKYLTEQEKVIVDEIDNASTVELYQDEECVNIKMSEEEIKQFKQMLQEHTPLYTVTSDTFVEGASAKRPQGEWLASDIRWTDKVSVKSNGDIIDFNGRVVGHINLEILKGGSENE